MPSNNIYHTTQHTEFTSLDLFLEEIIGLKTDGYFIEIGAFDGQTNSKTAKLADIGWSGLYVEPIAEYAQQCQQRHVNNKVKVMQAAIGDADEKRIMFKSGLPSTLVASNKDHLEAYANQRSFSFQFKEELVEVLSWQSLEKHFTSLSPDLFVLDAEGYDLKILESIDFSRFQPKIICTEVFPETTEFMHPDVLSEGKQVTSLLQKAGYHIWLTEAHNILFVKGRPLPENREALQQQPANSIFLAAAHALQNQNQFTGAQKGPAIHNFYNNGLAFFKQLLNTALVLKNDALLNLYLDILSGLNTDPSDQVLFEWQWMGYQRLNQWEKALLLVNNQITHFGKTISTISALAECSVKLNQYVKAADAYNWLCHNDPAQPAWKVKKQLVQKILNSKKTARRKVLCLLSCGNGHLDFGGMGYLEIARGLRNRGQEVVFVSVPFQCDRLRRLNFNTIEIPYIDTLWMVEENFPTANLGDNFINSLKTIELLIRKEKPDLVLVDNLLSLASGMLSHCGIPYVSIGAPGGYWIKNLHQITPGKSLHNGNGLLQYLKERLHWPIPYLTTCCHSPYHNITFMGKEFYPDYDEAHTSVNLFTQKELPAKNKLAISLGSGTFVQDPFIKNVCDTIRLFPKNSVFDLYGFEQYIDAFMEAAGPEISQQINIVGYKPFDEALKDVSLMIFAGGIGTIWQCLENAVVPIIVSGGVHDQDYNAEQLKRWRLGDVHQYLINPEKSRTEVNSLTRSLSFTDNMDTLLDKLTALH